jgi:aquaporin related protein
VAAGFYKFIKILEYETANPDQDATEAHIERLQNGEVHPMTSEEKAIVESHQANTNGLSNGYSNGNDQAYASGINGVAANGVNGARGTSYNSVNGNRPSLNMHQTSNKTRMESPAMATTDEAFHGLQPGGMHGNEFTSPNGGVGRTISGAGRTISGIV